MLFRLRATGPPHLSSALAPYLRAINRAYVINITATDGSG